MLQLLGNRYLIGSIAGVVLVAGVWLHGQHAGRIACQQAASQAANEIAQSYANQADKLREGAVQREQRTKVIVKEVYREKDPTGCADERGLDSVLDALRPSAD